jgi:hypothetical protein
MKKMFMVLLVLLMIATPCYALNFFDAMVCKKVVLALVNRVVLVNRFTGEVKYVLQDNATWVPVPLGVKAQYQSMYEFQAAK